MSPDAVVVVPLGVSVVSCVVGVGVGKIPDEGEGYVGWVFGNGRRKFERWLFLLGFATESKFQLRPVHCLLF